MQELMQVEEQRMFTQICEICCNEFNLENQVQICNPSVICYNCWHAHIKASVLKISYKTGSQILSPFQGRPNLDICLALNTLKQSDAQEIQEWLFKKYTSFTTDIEKCPSENCDYVFTMQKCKWRSNEDQKCPKCEASLLQSTGWGLKGIIGFIYFVFLTNKCPKCEIPIQKTTGCPHMTCPCGHQFCWYCLKDYYFNGNNLYSVHDPKQCACIFISKCIFMTICISGMVLTFLGNDFFQSFVNYFFLGSKYVMGAIIIDLVIIGNFVGVNYLYQKYRSIKMYGNHFGHTMNWKTVVALLLIIDISIFVILYTLDLHLIALYIVLFQLFVGVLVAGMTWLIVYTVQTWFDFIY